MDLKSFGLIGSGFIAGALLTSFISKFFISQRPVRNNSFETSNSQIQKQSTHGIACSYENDQSYESMKNQQVARIIKFFGEQRYAKLQNSFVIVFGVGGVGSHVVNMLARSGVKRIRIIDFDTVSLSSLNRHSFALREDVGNSKVDCIKKYIYKIFPHIQIQCINVYATVENVRTLLHGNFSQVLSFIEKNNFLSKTNLASSSSRPDYVIDCIDNLDAKVQLIAACLQSNLKLIVSGGAGMKSDPTRLQIRDVSDCKYDKLIMRLKRELTKKEIKTGFKVAFSYQQSEKELLPLTTIQEKDPNSYKVFDNYRIRIVPVLGTMPAILGMAISSYVLCDLAGQPYQPFQTDYVKSSSISKIYNQLLYEAKKRGIREDRFQVDVEEVSILAKKIYKWKCVVNPDKKGDRLAIWDLTKPITIQNLALMTKQNSDRHMKAANNIASLNYLPEVFERFESGSKEAQKLLDNDYMMFI